MNHLIIAPGQSGLGGSGMQLGYQKLCSLVKTIVVAGLFSGFTDAE